MQVSINIKSNIYRYKALRASKLCSQNSAQFRAWRKEDFKIGVYIEYKENRLLELLNRFLLLLRYFSTILVNMFFI